MTPLKFLILLVVLFLIFIGVIALYISDVVAYGLPSLEQLENPKQNLATQVLSSDGELLDHFYVQQRVSLPLDSIPKDFINALIATEDRAFYDHWGVHARRILTAGLKNVIAMGIKGGASTITMQLARNMFLNQEVTLKRKIREAFVAVQIEKTYTKNEILEMYINTVPFGRGAYGLHIASQVYFDKTPTELTTSECAFLVGLLKTPERYNGRDMDLALQRRNLVLRLMHEQDFITADKYYTALEESINLKTGKAKRRPSFFAPHFVEMVRQKLSRENLLLGHGYDLYRDGLIIHTTINSKIQKYANEAVEEHLLEFQKFFDRNWSWRNNRRLLDELIKRTIRNRADYHAAPKAKKKSIEQKLKKDRNFIDSLKNVFTTIQTGLAVIDPKSGAILALVGASPKFMREHPDSKYSLNHATQIKRQPGSAFKPLVYALVLEEGLTPESPIESGPYSYELVTGDIWTPRGSCDSAGTKVTLREGLRRSINSVAARLVTTETNPSRVVSLAKRMGIKSRLQAVPAIALGAGGEVSPLELVSAFGSFAYDGYHVEPYFITKIEDCHANVLYEKKEAKKVINDALKKETAHTMTRMMQNVVDHGTGYRVRQYFKGVDAAGKTGTTNENTDAWFIGYTPELVAGAWVGFDDQRISFGNYGQGGRAAAPIWGRLMSKIYKDDGLPYNLKEFEFNKIDSADSIYRQTFISGDGSRNPENPGRRVSNPGNEPKKNYQFPDLRSLDQKKKQGEPN